MVGRPSRMSGSGLETRLDFREGLPNIREVLPNIREVHPEVREWSEALPDVRECSGVPPGCPGVVGRPSRMSGSGRETLLDVRE